jgi:hypothetical protein
VGLSQRLSSRFRTLNPETQLLHFLPMSCASGTCLNGFTSLLLVGRYPCDPLHIDSK